MQLGTIIKIGSAASAIMLGIAVRPVMRPSRAALLKLLPGAVLALALGATTPAQAGLLGEQIEGFAMISGNLNFNAFNGTVSPPQTAPAVVAAPGVEYSIMPFSTALLTVDFSDDMLTLALDVGNPSSFGLSGYLMDFAFPDLVSSGAAIAGFNLISSDFRSCPGGIDLVTECTPDVVFDVPFATTFGPNTLSLQWDFVRATYHPFSHMPLGDQTVFTASFEIVVPEIAQQVPEPGALALFAAGLGLLAAWRRLSAGRT